MAQLANASFSINGNVVSVYSSFSLSQSIFEHHHFSLVCPAEAIDGKAGIFGTSKDMIGATFGARILAGDIGGNLLFNGVVTNVETSRYTGHHGDVIISGYSPTIMLESGPHCQSWEKKAVKNIANDVLKSFPQNLLNPQVQPLYRETLAYTVQYKETAWAFLQRIAGTFGEWLFWDGQHLVVGQPKSEEATNLVYGSHLSSFSMSLNAQPVKEQMLGWDYMNSQVYTSEPSGVDSKAGLNTLGKKVMQLGESVYPSRPVSWNNQFLSNKKQQDDLTNMRGALRSSRMVMFNGKSGHPGVKLGGVVAVSGSNVFSEQAEAYGEYMVVNVSHFIDAMGNYDNHFTAVPASIKVPPIDSPKEPNCETQSGIVTDNNDFNGLGRVRVKFHWMTGSEKTPWIRVTTPHAGGGKGMFFIPELGEEVIVGFEGDSAIKPYVIGTVYHGQANNSFSNAGNDVKALQSRSGNKLVLNDKDGSVHLTDRGGADMKFDGAGNATTNVNNVNTINTGETHIINVGKDQCMLTMDNAGNITLKGTAKIKLESGQSSIEMDESGNITINGVNIKVVGSTTTEVGNTGGCPGMKVTDNVVVTGGNVDLN